MFVLPVKKRLEISLHGIVALHVTRTQAAQASPFLLSSPALAQSRQQLWLLHLWSYSPPILAVCVKHSTLSRILNNSAQYTPLSSPPSPFHPSVLFHGNNKFSTNEAGCCRETFKRSAFFDRWKHYSFGNTYFRLVINCNRFDWTGATPRRFLMFKNYLTMFFHSGAKMADFHVFVGNWDGCESAGDEFSKLIARRNVRWMKQIFIQSLFLQLRSRKFQSGKKSVIFYIELLDSIFQVSEQERS